MPDVLNRRTLNRALLGRQMLLRRADVAIEPAVEHLVALQAQEPRDPYVALWSRLEGFDPEELSRMLLNRRIVRVLVLLRTTIHLVTAADALRIRPLVQSLGERTFRSTSFARNLAGLDLADVVAAGREALTAGPQTVGDLGARLRERWPDRDVTSLGYAVRYVVSLAQVPPRGLWRRSGAALCEDLERWLGAPLDPKPSLDELVLRYLRAYGPATAADARNWSGIAGIGPVMQRLKPGLRTFSDEAGRTLFDVPDGALPDPETPAPVRFLPDFDNVTLAHADRSRIVDRRYPLDRWLRGSTLVDGFVRGTWRVDENRDAATMRVVLDPDVGKSDAEEVRAEADRLLDFLAPDTVRREVRLDLLRT